MLILGLTGSIGMGKSTTAKLFAEAGVPVYDADAAVHKSMRARRRRRSRRLSRHDRRRQGRSAKAVARVVHDPAAIKQLEQIVHPMLGARRKKFFDDAEAAGAPVVVWMSRCCSRPAARSASMRSWW
jgi:dephospho-CoA kinase